jgi:hypothetical protein
MIDCDLETGLVFIFLRLWRVFRIIDGVAVALEDEHNMEKVQMEAKITCPHVYTQHSALSFACLGLRILIFEFEFAESDQSLQYGFCLR